MEATVQRRPKFLQIAETIQADIRAGRLCNGGKLLSYRGIASRYGVAYLTARRSVSLLARRGLIVREHRRGTFVRDSSQSQAALVGVLSEVSLADETAHFYRALLRALHKELRDQTLIGHVYDGRDLLVEHDDWDKSVAFQRFLKDLYNHSFAGLIALSLPEQWKDPRILTSIPKARFTSAEGQADVSVSHTGFTYESLAYLKRQQRTNVVYLRTLREFPDRTADLEGVKKAGRELGCAPVRVVQLRGVNPSGKTIESWAYQKTRDLVTEWRRTRNSADAILISDDIGARGVALALIKEGVGVPEDVTVLTLANEGIQHHYGIPVVKYEFPLPKIARRLVEVLSARMRDPTVAIQPTVVLGRVYETA